MFVIPAKAGIALLLESRACMAAFMEENRRARAIPAFAGFSTAEWLVMTIG